MSTALSEYDELRVQIERVRALLEGLIVRGLRTCGPDELSQIHSYAEHLEQTGAGHLASLLSKLQEQIERDERSCARTLMETQVDVRLLERLLTLRVVKAQYAVAIEAAEQIESPPELDGAGDEDGDADDASYEE
jgi:hypothetical protein